MDNSDEHPHLTELGKQGQINSQKTRRGKSMTDKLQTKQPEENQIHRI